MSNTTHYQNPPKQALPTSDATAALQALTSQVHVLTQAVAALSDQLDPWLTVKDMCKRFGCTPKTLTAMEQRGQIPTRSQGKWLRSELFYFQNRKANH